MSTAVIDSFSGEFRFLSNFYPALVYYNAVMYPTVEHAYQAAKYLDAERRMFVRAAETPREAKRRGRLFAIRNDWEAVKVNVMHGLLLRKFAIEPLRSSLLQTGSAELVEGNTWGDQFWGVCNGRGSNQLGKLLMAVRKTYGGV